MRVEKLKNTLRSLMLVLPMSDQQKVKIYYKIFTNFFEVMSEGSGILNYGQEDLCRRTVQSLPRTGRWLDVGCGLGGPARLLASENKGVDITGINISELQLEEAGKRTAVSGLADRVHIQQGDACAMPFREDEIFDGLYAIETAFHFPDKAAFAKEAHRVMKKNGAFALADMVQVEGGVKKSDSFVSSLFHSWLGIMNMHTVSKWKNDLRSAGFTKIEVEDVTQEVLVAGMLKANSQIEKLHSLLIRDYPGFLIKLVKWGNDWVMTDLENKPMRYVLIRAQA